MKVTPELLDTVAELHMSGMPCKFTDPINQARLDEAIRQKQMKAIEIAKTLKELSPLPCPKCGGAAYIARIEGYGDNEHQNGDFFIQCSSCGHRAGFMNKRSLAITAWNEICEGEIPELKPCPLCGGKLEISVHRYSGAYEVLCTNGNCPLSQRFYSFSKRETIEKWNRRFPNE